MAAPLKKTKRTRLSPAMNITPLVDVVLVLLIIFMVVTPMMNKQMWLHVPPKATADATPAPENQLPSLVLTLGVDGRSSVNGEFIELEELPARLQRMLNARADKVVFFDANSSLAYGDALAVMDLLRGHGIGNIAVLGDALADAAAPAIE
jgi:biopolymer transport protein TolR